MTGGELLEEKKFERNDCLFIPLKQEEHQLPLWLQRLGGLRQSRTCKEKDGGTKDEITVSGGQIASGTNTNLDDSGTWRGKDGGNKDEMIVCGGQIASGINVFSPLNNSLDDEFKCEICGNLIFLERKSFENHFKFWRHRLGLRRIGLPNSKIFMNITSVEEARVLWEKVRAQRRASRWVPEPDGEYEDAEGNRIYGQTYIDLQHQGLI